MSNDLGKTVVSRQMEEAYRETLDEVQPLVYWDNRLANCREFEDNAHRCLPRGGEPWYAGTVAVQPPRVHRRVQIDQTKNHDGDLHLYANQHRSSTAIPCAAAITSLVSCDTFI